jgi:hypothetical protein
MNSLNKGIEMNHISLKKVTLVVSTCVLASYFVSADEKVANLSAPTIEAISEKVAASNGLSIAIKDIPALLTKFDSNKNGLLNKAEVAASKSEMLAKHFKDIDQNADAEISVVELQHYFTAMKAPKVNADS